MKKRIMSIAASAAIFTTGAMAFDMESNGTIIDRIYNVSPQVKSLASYTGGVEADTNLTLSPNRQGDALIYPAYRNGDGWTTEISVRNTKNVAVIAKAVIYAKDNSRELLDFNLYLSPHDVAKFTIESAVDKDGLPISQIRSTDGSLAYQVSRPELGVASDFVSLANDSDRVLTLKMKENSDKAGYVIIYGMTQQVSNGINTPAGKKADLDIYHQNHLGLFEDYRKMLDVCRNIDTNLSNGEIAPWRNTFKIPASDTVLSNGTAIGTNSFLAPNVESNCTLSTDFTGSYKLDANFTSPSADALFGEVSMQHSGDRRALLLPATALTNYTADNHMMLWAEGEYAAIQDRRIADANSSTLSTYNTTANGIEADAKTFLVRNTYFSFEKGTSEDKNEFAFIITQPMKRALVMAGNTDGYWTTGNIATSSTAWGTFTLARVPWTEDEETVTAAAQGLVSINSPLQGDPDAAAPFVPEVATFTYDQMVEGLNDGSGTLDFIDGNEDGYIDLGLNTSNTGLPAIVSQMSSKNIDGEAQINWIYSATSAAID